MTSHPNRSGFRYFKVCPRGFQNEVTYYRVPLNKVEEVDAEYRYFEDENPSGYSTWTSGKAARKPGVAIDWNDRDRLP